MALNEFHYSIDKGTAKSIHNPSLVHHESIEDAIKYTKEQENKRGIATTWFSISEAEYYWKTGECIKCSGYKCLYCKGRGYKEVSRGKY